MDIAKEPQWGRLCFVHVYYESIKREPKIRGIYELVLLVGLGELEPRKRVRRRFRKGVSVMMKRSGSSECLKQWFITTAQQATSISRYK